MECMQFSNTKKNMKKLFISICLMVGLGVNAQNFTSKNFLNGSQVFITNNTTVLFGYTNIFWVGPTNNANGNTFELSGPFSGATYGYPNGYWSQTTNAVVPTLITNSSGVGYTAYWTNFNNAYSTTNPLAGGAVSTGVQTYGNPWTDVLNFSDRNGNAGATALTFTLTGTSSSATNTTTLTFAPLYGNGLGLVGTRAADKITFITSANGLTPVVEKTNLTSAQTIGVKGWRLLSVQTSDCTNNQVMLLHVGLNGFVP